MVMHTVSTLSLDWQTPLLEKRREDQSLIDTAIKAIENTYDSDPNKRIPTADLLTVYKLSEDTRLSPWAKIACTIANWVTRYVFHSHHDFYEGMLALDLKNRHISKISKQLIKLDLETVKESEIRTLFGQLTGFARAKTKEEIQGLYQDIQCAQRLKVVISDLEKIVLLKDTLKTRAADFGGLTKKSINRHTKSALIDIAARSGNHAIAEELASLHRFNPIILTQLLDGESCLVERVLDEYRTLSQAVSIQYKAFDSKDPQINELSELLQKPGSLSAALDSDLTHIYDTSIKRLGSDQEIANIQERFKEDKPWVTHLGVEYGPFLKQGGLGEALEGLIEAMALDTHTRLLFPLYSSLKTKIETHEGVVKGSFRTADGEEVTTYKIIHKGVEVLFFDHETFELDPDSPNIYDGDIPSRSRFSKFNACAASWLYQNKESSENKTDIIHLHDWHVATVSKILATDYPEAWQSNKIPAVVFTLHNNSRAAQGRTGDELAAGAYAYGLGLNPMLQALKHSDMVTTVSDIFGREIQAPERGEGLDPVMRNLAAGGKLVGILNGSNPDKWNPKADKQLKNWKLHPGPASDDNPVIDLTFGKDDENIIQKKRNAKVHFAAWLERQRPLLKKTENKANPVAEEGALLPPSKTQLFNKIDPSKPLFAVVTRYDSYQKGLDFYDDMIASVIKQGGQIALVGSQEDGEATKILDRLVEKYKDTEGVVIVRDEKTAKGTYYYQQGNEDVSPVGSLVRAATDVTFMTPRFEPSGLTQFEGWGFGTLVLSSDTGGLAESVTTPEKAKERGNPNNFNGWLFNRAKGRDDVDKAVGQAISYFKNTPENDLNEKAAAVMDEARLFAWNNSERRPSPVRQYFTVYEKARELAKKRHTFFTHSIFDRLKTVPLPKQESLAAISPGESKAALNAFLGIGKAPEKTEGPLARSMPVAYGEGICTTLHHHLGPQKLSDGSFRLSVMAPKASKVSVIIYDDEGKEKKRIELGKYDGGVWQTGLDFPQGTKYRLLINDKVKLDPYGKTHTRIRDSEPLFNVLHHDDYKWDDGAYMETKAQTNKFATSNTLEIFPQTWAAERGIKKWSDLAPTLIAHAKENGYSHIELMGVLPFPFKGSQGYQVIGHFAPDYRLGPPEEFKKLIDLLHQQGIGVIVDFIPAHVAKDDMGMGSFDGSHLYEISGFQKLSPQALAFRWGENLNISDPFVQSHLLSSANWLMSMHVDGLRVDAVRSMLNHHNPEKARLFMKHLNGMVKTNYPHSFVVAEDYSSTSDVIKPLENQNGLGFDGNWSVGFKYFAMKLLSSKPNENPESLKRLVEEQSTEKAFKLVKYISHDEIHPYGPSILDMVEVSDIESSRSFDKKCAKWGSFLALMKLLPGPNLLFMGADSFSDYKWKPMDPHVSRSREETRNEVENELDTETRLQFLRGLNQVVSDIGELRAVKIKQASKTQSAITYKLTGSKKTVLVLANFSEDNYFSRYHGAPQGGERVKPMSVKVIEINKDSKDIERQGILWDSSDTLPFTDPASQK